MKLKSLRLHGFKSFADSTTVEFHEGITAIVGPNGCGKSNIKDAVRWVLGEQRPSAIRGAKMEEAIFQGAVNRRPVNRGSVSMVVSNEDGALPIPFEEVEIGRTIYRNGGSDYSINRSTCRLKDIHELCRDTGLGANAYAVIENRMIDSILSDRADERRALFEEASGIGKYKDRRKEASRRIEQAEADLQRLDDVIAEVQTKVRSLSRQKGKAERYRSLRERRLAVEVSVVRTDIERFQARLAELDEELREDHHVGDGMVAELRTAETHFETLRIKQVEAEKARGEAAAQLEAVRSELVRWERDLAVAEQTVTYSERRLGQIHLDRTQIAERVKVLDEESGGLADALEGLERDSAEIQGALSASQERTAEIRGRLEAARTSLTEVEASELEFARKGAQLEGDADAAEGQAAELARRLQRLEAELEAAATELTDLQSQGDLFTGQVGGLERGVEVAQKGVAEAQVGLEEARQTHARARAEELSAAEASQAIVSELKALEALERARSGVDPAVKAALASSVGGVHGTLADFIDASEDVARSVESFLGPLTRGLVVENRQAARELTRWFVDEWAEGGGLLLLPLDGVPVAAKGGSLLSHVTASGKGGPWVTALLSGVELVEDESVLDGDGARLSISGAAVDPLGIVRIGNPTGATGVLERRERIKALTGISETAGSRASEAHHGLDVSLEALHAAEASIETAREALFGAHEEMRKIGAEAAAQVDRQARMDTHRDELARQIEGTRAVRAKAIERGEAAREDRVALVGAAEETSARRGAAREVLDAVETDWEAARLAESELLIRSARLEGETQRSRDRTADLFREQGTVAGRAAALEKEESGLREELAAAREVRERGAEATERLFTQRDDAEAAFRGRSQVWTDAGEAVSTAERTLREVRSAERASVDRRHRLELERQEVDTGVRLIQERLEGEWGRPLEVLLSEAEPVEADPEDLREELKDIVRELDRIGLVNMLAVEEHAEESARLEFLTEQQADLSRARNDLHKAILEINETAIALFDETFQKIRKHFRETFVRLFEGGEADLWLTDPEDPLESPIEIHASPRGKKTQRIDLLSGGERALTALSLLFGIYLVKPSPFCVLDEVDAPLDENNIGRFLKLIEDFKSETQFVVITHNPRTMAAADWIYGVTMEEPGVSKIVGVKLQEALTHSGSAA